MTGTDTQDCSRRKMVGRKCKKCGEFIPVFVHDDAPEIRCQFCGHVYKIVRYTTVQLVEQEASTCE